MDNVQKKIIVGYCIGIILIMLFVPWKVDWPAEDSAAFKVFDVIRYRPRDVGYSFIFSPPEEYPLASIDFSKLFIEFVILTAITGVIYLVRDKIFKKPVSMKRAAFKDKKPSVSSVSLPDFSNYRKVGTGDNAFWTFDTGNKASGAVTRDSDGKTVIGLGPRAGFITRLTTTFITFSNHLKDEEKILLADWGVVPIGPWTAKHREKFALALTHHFCDLKESGALVPDKFKGILDGLPSRKELPPLDRPLTNEVRRLFNGLFAGLGRMI